MCIRDRYITKFGFDQGNGNYKMRARLLSGIYKASQPNIQLFLAIFLDDDWQELKSGDPCIKYNDKAKVKNEISIPLDGSWTHYITGSLSQQARRRVWFFNLMQCDNSQFFSKDFYSGLRSFDIEIEMEILNTEENQFSTEERGFISPIFFLMLVQFVIFAFSVQKLYNMYKKEDEIDYPYLIVNLALLLQALSLLCEYFHLVSYSYDGVGLIALDFFHRCLVQFPSSQQHAYQFWCHRAGQLFTRVWITWKFQFLWHSCWEQFRQ
eukprot:TRINITY_DN14073_c0_g2_i2.p2 TRINITY_DN14073_c0_g2~~TRINITY_DN14073_c0_g2_i2.p2  ORF type:complete len:266 (+),score=15.81 TRINITY_DN14073_c0_g2_i2:101-898(+)